MSLLQESESSGWHRVSIGQVSRVIRGASPRPKGDPRYYGGNVPRLMVQDVTRDGKTVFPSIDFLTEEGAKRSRPCLAGTLTLVCSGTVGVPSFLGVDACIHDGFIGLVDISPSLSKDFLYHQLRGLQEQFDAAATHGGVFTNLTTEGVAAFEFDAPADIHEQQAIAEALSDADGLIEGLERLIAKKRLIKQGAMQDLLTAKRRLPGFSGEWELKTISELGQVKTGLTYSPVNVKPYGTLVLRSSNIQKERLAFENNVFVDVDVSEESTVRSGDLLICVRNGSRQLIGKTAIIDSRADGMAFGAFMSAFRSDLNSYLVWCFQSSVVQRQVAEHLGATINQITNKTLKSIEVPIPEEDKEREAISEVLTDMDAEIQALETRLAKARRVKEGMMQNLLTGRIRLV